MATIPSQLLRAALPLIPVHGFTTKTLLLASTSLHSSSSAVYTTSTLNALFPSPPARHTSRSLSRQELIQLAYAQRDGTREEHDEGVGERVGPALALLEAWLEEGRRVMVQAMSDGKAVGVRGGLEARVRYNENVLSYLPDALALLGSKPGSSSLSAFTSLPSPTGYLGHVAKISHDLVKASGGEQQGLEWYSSRGKVGTIYSMAELHMLSPSRESASERIDSTVQLVDTLIERSGAVEKQAHDAVMFADWIGKSWMGLGRSAGF